MLQKFGLVQRNFTTITNTRTNILYKRKVYDIFLAKFPQCAEYWVIYADHEADQFENMETTDS